MVFVGIALSMPRLRLPFTSRQDTNLTRPIRRSAQRIAQVPGYNSENGLAPRPAGLLPVCENNLDPPHMVGK